MEYIIIQKKRVQKTLTIKEQCLKEFENGLDIDETQEKLGYKRKTVEWYYRQYTGNIVYGLSKKGRAMDLTLRQPYSSNEMDYGTELPSYTWQSLEPSERMLIKHPIHKELCKLK